MRAQIKCCDLLVDARGHCRRPSPACFCFEILGGEQDAFCQISIQLKNTRQCIVVEGRCIFIFVGLVSLQSAARSQDNIFGIRSIYASDIKRGACKSPQYFDII